MRADSRLTRHWAVAAAAQGCALFIGGFTLVSELGRLHHPEADFTIWWVAVPFGPQLLAGFLLLLLSVALIGYAVAPRMRPWRRSATVILTLVFAAAAIWNGVDFYRARADGQITSNMPLAVPLSFVIAALLLFIVWAALRSPSRRRPLVAAVALLALATAVCACVFPLAQFYFFGKTDYRRPADVVVVFGAQVHENGRPSTALNDRMNTAIELYKQGLADHLLVSGATGESGHDEALVMRDLAIEGGVPAKNIIVDSQGWNTDATVDNSLTIIDQHHWQRVLVVSQDWHLPRIKLVYQREGWSVFTVPAGFSLPIQQTPRLMGREVAAFWAYYLRAVVY